MSAPRFLKILPLVPLMLVCIAPVQAQPITTRVLNPRHEDLKSQAEEAYQLRNFSETLRLSEEVLQEAPNDDLALHLRGSAKVEMGVSRADAELVRQGIEDARSAIRLRGTTHPEYYFPYLFGMSHLAVIENIPGHAETAILVVDQLLRDRPALTADTRANLLYQRALACDKLQREAEAIADLDRALRSVAGHFPSLMLKCELAVRSGDHDLAVATYEQASAAHPDNPVVHNNFGLYLFQMGRREEAIQRFSQAVEADPAFFMAHTNRAYVQMMSDQLEAAEAGFTHSLSLNPRQPVARRFRGETRLRLGRADLAVDDYRAVAQMQPNSPDAHAELGFALLFVHEPDAARGEFERALELRPQLKFLTPWLCLAMIESGAADAAADADVVQATLNKPADEYEWFDVVTLYLLGQINDGELLSAVNPADEGLSRGQQCEAFFFIGRKLRSEGQLEEASAFFEQALQVGTPRLTAYRGALQE